MALKILDTCVNCDVCEPACPENAISFCEQEIIYQIDPHACTECENHYASPQCQTLCPIPNCIIPLNEE